MYCTVRLVDYIKLKNTHFGITDSSSMAFPAWIIQAGIVLAVCVLLRCTLDSDASRPPGAQKLGAAECI
jgi:hypothetical protein